MDVNQEEPFFYDFRTITDFAAPFPPLFSVHVSSTSNHLQGCSLNLRHLQDQVMVCKRISGNWILLAYAQEFSLQWSWVWCARNASSIGGRGIHQGKVQGSGKLGGNGQRCGGMFRSGQKLSFRPGICLPRHPVHTSHQTAKFVQDATVTSGIIF